MAKALTQFRLPRTQEYSFGSAPSPIAAARQAGVLAMGHIKVKEIQSSSINDVSILSQSSSALKVIALDPEIPISNLEEESLKDEVSLEIAIGQLTVELARGSDKESELAIV